MSALLPRVVLLRRLLRAEHSNEMRPAYSLASALALVLLCITELFVVRAPIGADSLVLLVTLCWFLGVLHGVLWRGAFALLERAPRALQIAAWTAASFGAGHVLASRLGAYSRLSGPYASLAVRVLCASGILALSLAFVASVMQPTRSAPRGAVFAHALARRRVFTAILFVVAGLAFLADRYYYVNLYVAAHEALRWISFVSLMFALALVQVELGRPRVTWPVMTALVVLAVLVAPIVSTRSPASVQRLWMRSWSSAIVDATRRLVDLDRDGHSAMLGGDCDELDARVHAGQREIPGNGLDDNCMLGDAKKVEVSYELPPEATEASPYDVILITVDSLRPDHIGTYNPAYGPKGRDTMPNLDAWAKDASVFTRAYAPGGWTSVAIASLMRGLYPRRLEWTRFVETTHLRLLRTQELDALYKGESRRQVFPLAFGDPSPTLAQLFQRRGMHTAAAVHDGFSRMLSRGGTGIERGFDSYSEVEILMRDRQDDSGVVEVARREIARAPRSKRLFLWVHFFGPHSFNEHHPGTKEYGPTLVDGYDHELRFLDEQLPKLFAAIEQRRTPAIVVFTGDHGELFTDSIRMHGFSITDDDIRVPLIVRVPGMPPSRTDQVVSTIDIFPTLLEQTRTPRPARADGVDLSPWMRGEKREEARILVSESWRYEADGRPAMDVIAVFDGQRKVVRDYVRSSLLAYPQGGRGPEPTRLPGNRDRHLLDYLYAYEEATGGPLLLRD